MKTKNNNKNKKSAKKDPLNNSTERLYLPALSEPVETDEEERILKVTITTRDRDREGDIVEPSGLDFENFLKNPVVLWAHDTTSHPLGRVREITVFEDRVDAIVQFADTEQGHECFILYRDRYLNAWSIGFIPRKWTKLSPTENDPRPGLHITEAEVVELSAVPVPANPGALTRDIKDGTIKISEHMQKALDIDETIEIETESSTNPSEQDGVAMPQQKYEPENVESKKGCIPLHKAIYMARQKTLELIRTELENAIAIAKGRLA